MADDVTSEMTDAAAADGYPDPTPEVVGQQPADPAPAPAPAAEPRRKRGRPRKTPAPAPAAAEQPAAEAAQPAMDPDALGAMAEATATTLVDTLLVMGAAIGGDEWRPVSDPIRGIDERTQLITVWTDYFVATGSPRLPAWLAPAAATAFFVLPRLQMPQTRERLSKLFRRKPEPVSTYPAVKVVEPTKD